MPVDYKKDYHPKWHYISHLIRNRRAQGRCEWCGVLNGAPLQMELFDAAGRVKGTAARPPKFRTRSKGKPDCVTLTVAHLDQDRSNNRFWNLAALCQRCHLNHDRQSHIDNRRYGREWKRQPMLISPERLSGYRLLRHLQQQWEPARHLPEMRRRLEWVALRIDDCIRQTRIC